MDIFDYINKNNDEKSPLAMRVRPKYIEEIIGQEHILSPNKLLYRAIKADKLGSLILYGPPGTGKTTLAKVIANTTKAEFTQLNATVAGKKDIQNVIKNAKETLSLMNKKTILFIDEIHRFNKAQQDALLSYVEDGTVIFIGATTENPYFEVNKALISRSRIFELKSLDSKDIVKIIERAIKTDSELLKNNVCITKDAKMFLANISNGDARLALNAIELAYLTTDSINGSIEIDLKTATECVQKRAVGYDKKGDNHYDTISAFIKSMRGSDPQASVYYLARMLYAGEDPKFIARRIVICASEDVGNADPQALVVAVNAANAVNFIGMPEARIILSQAATYIASAPKSNAAYIAIDSALKDVEQFEIKTIPPHLKDAHYKSASELGNGIGYKYPHSFEGHYTKQQYLPDELIEQVYYEPSNEGYEKTIKHRLEHLK